MYEAGRLFNTLFMMHKANPAQSYESRIEGKSVVMRSDGVVELEGVPVMFFSDKLFPTFLKTKTPGQEYMFHSIVHNPLVVRIVVPSDPGMHWENLKEFRTEINSLMRQEMRLSAKFKLVFSRRIRYKTYTKFFNLPHLEITEIEKSALTRARLLSESDLNVDETIRVYKALYGLGEIDSLDDINRVIAASPTAP